MIGTVITGVTALVFPMFASYRALVSNDITLIRPWLMYWVVFASFEFVESVFRPILQFVPFYGLIRLGFVCWLVLPQTQGAVQLYQTRIEPWLNSHDQLVDAYIAKAIEFLRNSPVGGILAVFGISLPKPPPKGGAAGAGASSSGPNPGSGASNTSIVDSLMSSFRLPATPDINLAAYLPAMLGSTQEDNRNSASQENSSIVRNRLLSIVKYLESRNGPETNAASASSSSRSTSNQTEGAAVTSREVDGYDFVEAPKDTPPASAGETEIEREIEEKLLSSRGQASESSTSNSDPRRRWF